MTPDGNMTLVNRGLARRFGRTVDALTNTSTYDLVAKEVANRRRQLVKRVLDSGEPLTLEDEGSGYHIENRIYPIKNETNTITHLAVFGRDITDRKLAEEALREREERLRILFEQAADAIFVSDLDGNLVQVNKRARAGPSDSLKGSDAMSAPASRIQHGSVRDSPARRRLFAANLRWPH